MGFGGQVCAIGCLKTSHPLLHDRGLQRKLPISSSRSFARQGRRQLNTCEKNILDFGSCPLQRFLPFFGRTSPSVDELGAPQLQLEVLTCVACLSMGFCGSWVLALVLLCILPIGPLVYFETRWWIEEGGALKTELARWPSMQCEMVIYHTDCPRSR